MKIYRLRWSDPAETDDPVRPFARVHLEWFATLTEARAQRSERIKEGRTSLDEAGIDSFDVPVTATGVIAALREHAPMMPLSGLSAQIADEVDADL